MLSRQDVALFEDARPALLGLAYRILGTLADAEDAVQDTYLRWAKTDRETIGNSGAWLRTTCTRRCLDLLKSAHRSRVNYVGAWLPEPIHTPVNHEAEHRAELASSLTTAFLLLLDRLSPKERAAYLLHEVFDVAYSEIAATLGIQEAACRKLVSRAKQNVAESKVRHSTSREHQNQLLGAFQEAVTSGVTDRLAGLLTDDIRFSVDTGGKAAAVHHLLRGKSDVLAFIAEALKGFWGPLTWVASDLNGGRGFMLKLGGDLDATVSFAYDDGGLVTDIFVVRNPDKLNRLDTVRIH